MTQAELDALSDHDLLQLIARNARETREDFWDGKTVDQILQIGRMHLLSGWDIYPDEWTERQVREALAGKPPSWDRATEEPVYEESRS